VWQAASRDAIGRHGWPIHEVVSDLRLVLPVSVATLPVSYLCAGGAVCLSVCLSGIATFRALSLMLH